METVQNLQEYLTASSLKGLEVKIQSGELVIQAKLENLEDTVRFLKEDPECWFRQLIDICGVDYPDRTPRFDVVYHFLSLKYNLRVRLIVSVEEGALVPSLTNQYRAAGWFEREVYDMYGVKFNHHEDLRRILTDYHFDGHPLRKDFPLSGFTEVYYSKEQERVASRPVNLKEPFREFNFESSWKGMKTVLAKGDEE